MASETKYRMMVENASEGILVAQDGIIRFLNQKIAEISGYSMEEALFRPFVDFVHPDDKEMVMEHHYKRLMGAEAPEPYDLRMIDRGGNIKWLRNNGVIITWQGKPATLNFLTDITESKQFEQKIVNNNALFAGLNRIFRDKLTCKTEDEIARVCLSVAEELTGSQFGFIAEINAHGLLDTIAMSDPGWDACVIPRSDAYEKLRNIKLLGYWDRVIKGSRILIVNDPASHPQAIRTPEGHPQITSFMGTPLFNGESVFGMIALANKTGGYDTMDRENMALLAQAVVEILLYTRTERNVHFLSRQLLEAHEDERRVISRELHDRVAQQLSAIKMGYDSLFADSPKGAEGLGLKASELSGMFQEAIMAVRDLSYELRPPGIEKTGLVGALFSYCNEFSQKTGVEVKFSSIGMQSIELDDLTSINIYRMVQEGLMNIHKHAAAANAKIICSYSYPYVLLTIEDNGRGFDVMERLAKVDSERRMGLRSMEQRAHLLQGSLKIQSRSMRGTKIFIRIPHGKKANG